MPGFYDLINNMKRILTIFTLLGLCLTCFGSEKMETEFEARFKAFIEAKNLKPDVLKEIWIIGDSPFSQIHGTQGSLEQTMARGISSFEIVEIYSGMKEGIMNPVEIEGETYQVNLKPYKMMQIEYVEKIEGGSAGWSYLLGERNGKLYMVGLRKIK